uniref:Major sperm protein n=1 Tax=Panagrolaimus sp. PS1159 TaxID=55785 RepID=A0AC35GWQ8_9BILA
MGGENKKNEPEFQMKLEPDEKVAFKGKHNETVAVKVTNTTKTRQCFKVKTSSNDMFRLRPPLGFVAPNETATISITFLAKEIPPNGHYVVFYHTPCKDDDKKPRSVWTPSTNPEGVRRVVADFVKEDAPAADKKDAPAKDAKDTPAKDGEAKDAKDGEGKDAKDTPAKDAKDAPAKDAKDAPAKDAEGKDAKDAPAKDEKKEGDEAEKDKEKE